MRFKTQKYFSFIHLLSFCRIYIFLFNYLQLCVDSTYTILYTVSRCIAISRSSVRRKIFQIKASPNIRLHKKGLSISLFIQEWSTYSISFANFWHFWCLYCFVLDLNYFYFFNYYLWKETSYYLQVSYKHIFCEIFLKKKWWKILRHYVQHSCENYYNA